MNEKTQEVKKESHSREWQMGYDVGYSMPHLLPPSNAREFVNGFLQGKRERESKN
jgi:hypothetical protein